MNPIQPVQPNPAQGATIDLSQPFTFAMNIPRALETKEIAAMEARIMGALQEQMNQQLAEKLAAARHEDAGVIRELRQARLQDSQTVQELQQARQLDGQKIKALQQKIAWLEIGVECLEERVAGLEIAAKVD